MSRFLNLLEQVGLARSCPNLSSFELGTRHNYVHAALDMDLYEHSRTLTSGVLPSVAQPLQSHSFRHFPQSFAHRISWLSTAGPTHWEQLFFLPGGFTMREYNGYLDRLARTLYLL